MAAMDKEINVSDVERAPSSIAILPVSPQTEISSIEYRKLIWKLDLHLLPPLFALWFVSLVDRVNIGSANIFGLQPDLHMNPKGNDLNVALIIVLIGLITMEVPSNLLVKKISPSKVLAAESLLLALCTIGQGVITDFAGLKAMRFFIGVFEAGLIPGSVFLLAQYYPRYELQRRMSLLMVGYSFSVAFGGLLALSIAGIKAHNEYRPWRWIFIIEGCITACVTIVAYFFMSDWPSSVKWLSNRERDVLADRIRGHGQVGKIERLDSRSIRRILLDWKIYICGVITCCTTVTAYSVSIFAPTIINQFKKGQSPRHVQALVIPIFLCAGFGSLLIAYVSDKLKHRSAFAFFGFCLSTTGAAILKNQKHHDIHVNYAALYFMATGSYIAFPMLWTMLVNNISGSYKIGFAVAVEVGIGNVGGIASALVFQGKQAPLYRTGYTTILWMSVAAAVLVVVYSIGLWVENKARDNGKRGWRLAEKDADNLGDDHPSFRYVY